MEITDIPTDALDRPEGNDLLSNYSLHDVGEAYLTGRLNQIGLQIENWGIDKRGHDDGLIFDNKMDLRLWEPIEHTETPQQWPHEAGIPADKTVFHEPELRQFDVQQDGARTVDANSWRLRGVVDVKTKSNRDWLGVFNLRHLAHYAEHAAHYSTMDVPTFLYFTMVDEEAEEVGEENLLAEIPSEWEWEPLVEHYDRDTDYSLSYGELKDTARTCPIVKRTWRAPDSNLVVTVDDDSFENFDYIVEEVL